MSGPFKHIYTGTSSQFIGQQFVPHFGPAMEKTYITVFLLWVVLFKCLFCFLDAKNLVAVSQVESLREKVYASLEEYCKTKYAEEPGRFAKLLLRLPALRSIGLKCLEHLFYFELIGQTPIDTFIMNMLEAPESGQPPHASD